MSHTGLLVVSNFKKLTHTLNSVKKYVNSLYIHLNVPASRAPVPSWGRLVSQVYVNSSTCNASEVNLSVLVGPLKGQGQLENLCLKPIDIMFSDAHYPELCEQLRKKLGINKPTIYLAHEQNNDLLEFQQLEPADKICVYNSVVLGGTFDRIHLGHKIFLSQAALRSCSRLTVGVTTSQLIQSKTLHELILPVETRMKEVLQFLREIDSTLEYNIVSIDDPFGPTKSDPDMDLIVVSSETLKGGERVNELRLQNGLKPLDIFCIDLVEASDKTGPKESKASSSNTRIDMLGCRIKQPEFKNALPSRPYLIGLTGGIASGKSKMAQRFKEMGALVMDCDKIAHEVYEPGQKCYDAVVKEFGSSILDTQGRIDRSKLGSIVFGHPASLEKLNSIVWPEIIAEVKKRIQVELEQNTCPNVVVIEAAVLLKAGWEKEVHEVWSMIVPPKEAIRRVMERNRLSEEEAKRRLASQMQNNEVVARSHVVFSSQWDMDFTLKQAEKAWNMLTNELALRSSNL